MSVKEYRFFGQVQEVNDIGETTDAGWSVFCTWVKQEDYARLKAENERLRKAGDAMAETLKNGGIIISGYILADDWFKAKHLAAKEGKSKS